MRDIIQLVFFVDPEIIIDLPQDLDSVLPGLLSVCVEVDPFFHDRAGRAGFDQREGLLPESLAVCPFDQFNERDLVLFEQRAIVLPNTLDHEFNILFYRSLTANRQVIFNDRTQAPDAAFNIRDVTERDPCVDIPDGINDPVDLRIM